MAGFGDPRTARRGDRRTRSVGSVLGVDLFGVDLIGVDLDDDVDVGESPLSRYSV